MSAIKITTKTSEQIDAEFALVFKNVKPLRETKPLTQADRLAPYRKAIMKQRLRGLTWKQIADEMARPPIEEKVTERLLKKVFGPKPKAPVATPAAAPKAPAPVAPKPARTRLILDPLTGLPITPN